MVVVQAKKAQDFHNSIGVNVHLNYYPQYGNFARIKELLLEVGIKHVRDASKEVSKIQELGAAGIKTLYIGFPWIQGVVPNLNYGATAQDVTKTPPSRTLLVDLIKQIGPNYISALEGPNELDLGYQNFVWSQNDRTFLSNDKNSSYWWGHYAYNISRDTKAALASDSATSHLKYVAPSPGFPYTYSDRNPMKSMGAVIDFGCGHYYEEGGNGFQNAGGYAGLDNYYGEGVFPGNRAGRKLGSTNLGEGEDGNSAMYRECSEQPFEGKPMWITECGYNTAASPRSVSNALQAKLLCRMFVEYFRLGFVKSYSYEFIDKNLTPEGTRDREDAFGLVTNDLIPKPSFVQLKTLINAIEESSTDSRSSAGSLDYNLNFTMPSGYDRPNYVKQVLLQKGNGTFVLLVYHNIASARETGGISVALTHPGISATLNLPASYNIKATRLGTSTTVPTPVTTLTSAFNFTITDNVTIIEISNPTSGSGLGLSVKNIGGATGNGTTTGTSCTLSSNGSGYEALSDVFTLNSKTTSNVNDFVEAKVTRPTGNTTAKSGIMFRQDLDPKAQFYSLAIKSDGTLIERYRLVYGEQSLYNLIGTSKPTSIYFRINKVGDTYQGQYRTSTSASWINLTTQTINLGTTPESGVFLSSSGTGTVTSTTTEIKLD